ncbi:MAG: glyoxylate reductase [Archaeoglobi archaeon]|nr:glyoxylate reductase [Archaeoglobi archaeon]MDK2781522.1 glyoxylate reductase [Archaeoglobi archaeon]
MRKPKVFITRELFPETIERIEEFYEVELWDKYQEPSYEELLERSKDADALLTLVSDRVDCNLLKNAKKLRIVAQCAVGYNNIDVNCATSLGIYVTNTPRSSHRSDCRADLGSSDVRRKEDCSGGSLREIRRMVETQNCMASQNVPRS